VGNTVPVHDLRTTKLKVRCVDFTAKQLVDSLSARENDRLALDLNGTLSEADKVGTNTCGNR
jgi:hypothetical protein